MRMCIRMISYFVSCFIYFLYSFWIFFYKFTYITSGIEDYIDNNLSVLNKFTDLKNNSHWAYYDIMEAANAHLAVSSSENETWVK